MKIAILEDEKELREVLEIYLLSKGFEVDSFDSFTKFYESWEKNYYSLIVADINLVDGNFLEIIKNYEDILRYSKVIVISAHSEIENIKKSFDIGADDFIKKPFDYEELEIRINKIFSTNQFLELKKGILLDLENKGIIKHDQFINLTKKEYDLLEILIQNKNKFVSADFLISKLWGDASYNNLAVLIKRIREKIDKSFIENKKELGYRIVLN